MKDDSVRDKAIDKLVAARLRAGLKAGSANCPNAEALACYVERTLAPRERAGFETHIASCARCQESVAALVRLSESDGSAGARIGVAAPSRAATLFGFRWAWAGTALAAVLIAGILYTGDYWNRIRQPEVARAPLPQKVANEPPTLSAKQNETAPAAAEREADRRGRLNEAKLRDEEAAAKLKRPKTSAQQSETAAAEEFAVAPAQNAPALAGRTPASTAQPSAAPPAARMMAAHSGGIATPSVRAQLAHPQPEGSAGTAQGAGQAMDQAAGHGTGGGVVRGTVSKQAGSADKEQRIAPSAAAPPSPSRAFAPAANAEMKSKKALVGEAQANAESASKAAASQALQQEAQVREKAAADASGGAAQPTQSVTVQAQAATQTVEVQAQTDNLSSSGRSAKGLSKLDAQTTSEAPAWRVGSHGLIQELNSKGKWKNRRTGVKTDLNQILFVSPSVGWVVGQAGTILRTTDGGETWTSVSSPTDDDLTRITASGDWVIVVARSGQAFGTTDGGKTWTTWRNQ
jgi:hypothetical protein